MNYSNTPLCERVRNTCSDVKRLIALSRELCASPKELLATAATLYKSRTKNPAVNASGLQGASSAWLAPNNTVSCNRGSRSRFRFPWGGL